MHRPKGGDGEPVQPVYGEPAWIVVTGLRLIVRRGVTLEVKKPALQMVLLMFQGGLSRPTDACVLLEGLKTIRTWILDPPTPGTWRHQIPWYFSMRSASTLAVLSNLVEPVLLKRCADCVLMYCPEYRLSTDDQNQYMAGAWSGDGRVCWSSDTQYIKQYTRLSVVCAPSQCSPVHTACLGWSGVVCILSHLYPESGI